MQSKYKIGTIFNTGLNSQESITLRRRGFLVMPGVLFTSFLYNIFSGFIISGGIVGILFYLGIFFGLTFSFVASGVFLSFILVTLLYSTLFYAISSKYFFVDNGIITFGKAYNSIGDAKKVEGRIFIMKRLSEKVTKFFYKTRKTAELIDLMKILGPFGMIIGGVIYLNKYFPAFTNVDILKNIFILFSPLISLIGLAFIVKTLLESFHPLYAFGNIGSKIQSLTPTIEEKSREIQANFGEDMNFGKLRSGFDELSRSLAKVSEYIVKLELAEKKANKGNLFDSTKYINSLKGDIVKPLIALRSFLSTRLRELEESKGEMQKMKVRVGGGEESLALQSARTEPLMEELRDNIEKLDVMIRKF